MNLDAATIAPWLNRLPFVRWDRFVRAPVPVDEGDEPQEVVDAYGWIDRPDGRADFVSLLFASWSDVPGYTTSSAERSAEIAAALYGEGGPHYACQRVEDFFGALVDNKIVLA